jgi:hypothetical protein
MFVGSKARPVFTADNPTAICEPIVYPCYGDSFTLWRRSVLPVRYELDCKYCYK